MGTQPDRPTRHIHSRTGTQTTHTRTHALTKHTYTRTRQHTTAKKREELSQCCDSFSLSVLVTSCYACMCAQLCVCFLSSLHTAAGGVRAFACLCARARGGRISEECMQNHLQNTTTRTVLYLVVGGGIAIFYAPSVPDDSSENPALGWCFA